jgi:hypothetical protein
MSNHGGTSENRHTETEVQIRKEELSIQPESTDPGTTEAKVRRGRYPDMQSAVRFPIKLPISVKSESGESQTETQNISANGVLFQVDSEMPLGAMVDFTISLPAEVVGAEADVQLDCRGRVVRSSNEGGHRDVAVVIDEYRFDRR